MITYAYLLEKNIERKTHHYGGNSSQFSLMDIPDFIIIEEDKKETKGFFLWRYKKTGDFVGDTWHPNLEEAKEQAEFEYGSNLGEWIDVPESVPHTVEYVLEIIKMQKRK